MIFLNLKVLVFSLLIFCIFNVEAQGDNLTLGYLESGLKDLDDVDHQLALQLLAKELIHGDSNVDLSVVSINNMQEMLDLIKAGKINYGIINSYYYLNNIENLQPFITQDFWAIQRSHQSKEDYVLVVREDIEYQGIKSLAGKRLSIRLDYLMMNFYLKYLVKKNTNLSVERFFKSVKNTKTTSQSVLDVFFNTSDACIVPEYILDLVTELNPAVTQRVKVVHHSGANFIPALALTFNNTPEIHAKVVRNNIDGLSDNVRGQEIIDLFNINSISKVDPGAIDFMLEIFNEYKKLESVSKHVNKAAP